MNDKVEPVFLKIDKLLAQMQADITELRQAMMIVAEIPPNTMAEHTRKAKRSELVVKVVQGLMSGRWHRRDGDAYGIVRQPGVPRDADNPPGDLRLTSERRD